MAGAAFGLIGSAVLGKLGKKFTQQKQRDDQLTQAQSEAAMQSLSGMMKDPNWNGDPEARKQLEDSYWGLLENMAGKSKDRRKAVATAREKVSSLLTPRPGVPAQTRQVQGGPGAGGGAGVPGGPVAGGISIPMGTPATGGIATPFSTPDQRAEAADKRMLSFNKEQSETQNKVASEEDTRQFQTRQQRAKELGLQGDEAQRYALTGTIPAGAGQARPSQLVWWQPADGSKPFKIRYDSRAPDASKMFAKIDGSPIDPQSGKIVDAAEAKDPGETAEMRTLADAYLASGKAKDKAEAMKMAGQEIIKKNQQRDTAQTIRIETGPGGSQGQKDAKEIAQGIINGDQPPTLTGLYRIAGPVRAELERNKFNLREATLDWSGTQRWLSTLNGAQQTRLRQATDFAFESLDVIDDLSKEVGKHLDRSKFPILNRAALTAAKNGLMGEEAAIAAGNLEQQINDLQSEIATVYKGGNSPTDIGLKQATAILSSDWDEKRLKSAVDLARRNLRIRLNSIKQTGPVTFTGRGQGDGQQGVGGAGGPGGGATGTTRPKPPKQGAALDTENAKLYLKLAGNDNAKAAQLATQDGWGVK